MPQHGNPNLPTATKKRRRWPWIVGGVLVVGGIIQAVNGPAETPAVEAAPAVAAPVAVEAPPVVAPPVAPAVDQRAAFLARVQEIAPPLAEFPDRVIGRGENTCSSLTNVDAATGEAWSEDRIVDQAEERFSGGSYTVTREQAAQLVQAARETVCA